jgi:hypothetical protein
MPSKPKGSVCTVLAIDPGETTGLAVVSVDVRWLRGLGSATWDGLGKAVRSKVAYQVGRDPKEFSVDRDRATRLDNVDEALMPILAGQPLEHEDGMRSTERFYSILSGEHEAGGGDLTTVQAGEVAQVRQIAGLLENYPNAALVIEGFTLRGMNSDPTYLSPDRLRLVITVNEILHGSSGRLPFLQQPSYAKGTATDERLRRAGLYFPGMGHATDAARHAATFLRDARKQEATRAAAFPRHFTDEFDD